MDPETSHVQKITYGPLIDTALYVMCLMGEIHYKGHWKGWAMKVDTFLGRINHRSINSYYWVDFVGNLRLGIPIFRGYLLMDNNLKNSM